MNNFITLFLIGYIPFVYFGFASIINYLYERKNIQLRIDKANYKV